MPISDSYVVQYLIQNTVSGDGFLLWRDADTEGYFACINGIKVEFGYASSRTGTRFYLTLTAAPVSSIQIVEPHNIGFFRPKYANDDEERLAHLMKDLDVAIRRQYWARRKAEAESASAIRESIYRRLLGVHAGSRDSG